MRRWPWLPVLVVAACGGGTPSPGTGPTYARDVAPLLFRSCTPCHRPGQPAPFPLLSYADAAKKRTQMAEVTRQRVMPPWLMCSGSFAGDRRLSATDIEMLQQWAAAGAPRGDAAAEPPPPEFPAGWQWREPDLVVEVPDTLEVPAAGPNLFRNLVVPIDAGPLRYVEAVEIRPNSPAVHHAVLAVDSTRTGRRLDAQDAEPGFPGTVPGAAVPPDGHFLGWTPGKRVRREPPGLAWRLWPGQDLVLQLHMVPTGKVERVRPTIGLYFTDVPTAIEPYPIVLFSEEIDLPPGQRDFVLRDHVTVPVPIVVQQVYPHAHYLCRTMRAAATLPGGEVRELFRIDAWDFDWQDDYQFAPPVELPAGTTLSMEYHYDNSDGNPSNPHRPPVRVGFGQASEDEMGTLTMMVQVAPADRVRLAEACVARDVEKCPRDAALWRKLCGLRRELGQAEASLAALREAERRAPGDPDNCYERGLCAERAGDATAAEVAYGEALRRDPGHGWANLQLGSLLARSGRREAAIRCFETALAALPNLPMLHCNLGTARFTGGELAAAERCYRRALQIDAGYTNARFLLGRVLAESGRKDEARAELQRVLQAQPNHPGAAAALRELGR